MRVITDQGETIDLGNVETTPTIGITDFSRRVTDDFGITTVVKRSFSRRMSVKLGVPISEVDALQRRLADLRAAPALWVADDRFASLSMRGFYKDFDLDLATPAVSYCTLTVEGLAETATPDDVPGDPAPPGDSSTLQLIQPIPVTAIILASSTVPQNDAVEWSSTATYAVGARVMRAATHRLYENLTAANVGNDPAGVSGKWLDVGPTNRWAMFDEALGTATANINSIQVVLNAVGADTVALLDVVATSVSVQATGYDRALPASSGAITFLDLPADASTITVTITGTGAVSVGTLLLGRVTTLGLTEASPTAGITDYSRKDVDQFGEVAIVERAWAKRMTARALIRTDAVDMVANRIAAVRAQPSLWIGQIGLESLTVYGFFKEFSIEVGDSVSKLSLSIEGLSTAAKIAPIIGQNGEPGVRGDDGLPGANGADGQTLYTAYAYANSPDGRIDFVTGEPSARGYIGVATNLSSPTEPADPSAYIWSQYRGPAFGVATRGGAVVIGNTVLKNYGAAGVGGGWDADAFSTSGYKGAASVGFRLVGGADIMSGLNTDPTADASWTSLDFAFYRASGDQIRAYESGSEAMFFGAGVDDNTRYRIDYDGLRVTYYINDEPRRQVHVGSGKTFYFDSSIVSTSRIEDLTFSGGSRAGGAITLIADTPTTVVGADSIIGIPPEAGWGSVHAHSVESFSGGAVAQWMIPGDASGQNAMVGLGQSGTNGLDYAGITFSIFQQEDGYVDARVNGNGFATPTAVNPAVDNRYKMHFDGLNVRFYVNGVEFATYSWGRQPDPLFFVAALASHSPRVAGITFTAAGAIGVDGSNGTDGAPGTKGADGQTSYFHTAYANSENGQVDFHLFDPVGRAFIGSYSDFTAADSLDPAAYSWTAYTGPAFGMATRGGISLAGTTIVKTASTNAWDADAFSTIAYIGGASASFRGLGSGHDIMAGLNTDPSADTSYGSIDYAWYLTSDGKARIYENGAQVANTNNPSQPDVWVDGYGVGQFQVVYNGKTVRYMYNGGTYLERQVAPNLTFYFDSSFVQFGAKLTDVAFTAAGTAGNDGLPGTNGTNGLDGTHGQSVHIAYANSTDGYLDFTTGDAGDRTYIGVYTDTNPGADSGNPASYGWTRLKGLDGAQGLAGPGGYVHTAWADSADGNVNLSITDPGTRTYLGIYTDQTAADSSNPAVYAWSLIKGADGSPGRDGANGKDGASGPKGDPLFGFIQEENPGPGQLDLQTWYQPVSKQIWYWQNGVWNKALGTLAAQNLIASNAQIGDAVIISAHIKDLEVDTIKIKNGAVTASAAMTAQNAQVNANTEVSSASATIITSSTSAVRIEYKCLANYIASQGGTSNGCYGTIVRIANGVETAVLPVKFAAGTFTDSWAYDFPPEGQVTYVLRFRDYIASGSGGYYWIISQIQLGILGFKR